MQRASEGVTDAKAGKPPTDVEREFDRLNAEHYIEVSRTATTVHVEEDHVRKQPEQRDHRSDHSYVDRSRVETATERLRALPEVSPDHWRTLDNAGKAAALNQVGAVLSEIYQLPRPPLLVHDLGEPSSFGAYGNGYRFDSDRQAVVGSEYGIQLNEKAQSDFMRMFGDDPRLALETYTHEFRHAYQSEQVLRARKPQFRNLVDDPDAARAWDHAYVSPEADFLGYWNQPVERDARDFAETIVASLFGLP